MPQAMRLDDAAIARIVARAYELGPRERPAYLRLACAHDPEALQRILHDHSLLTEGHAEDAGSEWAVDRSGQVLWPWRLMRRIGGGGMSDVYLAERCDEYQQQVAVKLVRPGLVSRADHNRLKAERQILARLNHRNIARLLDGGTTDDGIPYLVMEYVDGLPIDEYCERHQLSIRERLALFRGICAGDSDPSRARGEKMTAREILERGAERIASLKNQPEEQATLMETIGRTYLSLGSSDKARPQLEGALAARRKLFDGDHAAIASSLASLGNLELTDGRFDGADRYYSEALAMNERLFGEDRMEVAQSLEDLGKLQKMKGELPAAEATLRRSLALFSKLSGATSTAASSVMNELAQVMERLGDLAAAEHLYRQAIAIDTATLGTDHPQVAHNLHNLAVVLQERGDFAGARPLFEQSFVMLRKVLGDTHPDTIEALGNYGRYLQARGELSEAEKILREALALDEQARGKEHVQVGYDHVSLGYLLNHRNSYADAENEFREALGIYATSLPAEHVYVASARTGLGEALIALGRLADGYAEETRALDIWRKSVPAEDVHIANTEAVMAHALALQGHFDQAEPLLSASYSRMRTVFGPNDARTQRASTWLAELYRSTNRPDLGARLLAGTK